MSMKIISIIMAIVMAFVLLAGHSSAEKGVANRHMSSMLEYMHDDYLIVPSAKGGRPGTSRDSYSYSLAGFSQVDLS